MEFLLTMSIYFRSCNLKPLFEKYLIPTYMNNDIKKEMFFFLKKFQNLYKTLDNIC